MKKLITSLLICCASIAWAEKVQPLEGVQSALLTTLKLDEASKTCGLSHDLIDAAVRTPISKSKLRIANDKSSGLLTQGRTGSIPVSVPFNDTKLSAK